jgi:hypothetical protein
MFFTKKRKKAIQRKKRKKALQRKKRKENKIKN